MLTVLARISDPVSKAHRHANRDAMLTILERIPKPEKRKLTVMRTAKRCSPSRKQSANL
jgi:hypothetical protein